MTYELSRLWNEINQYVVTCGGDPSKNIYENIPRQNAVVAIEHELDILRISWRDHKHLREALGWPPLSEEQKAENLENNLFDFELDKEYME
jgi:hypothetical protein